MNDDFLVERLRAMKHESRLEKDLWPRMERRMAQRGPRFSEWDWAIAAGIAAAVLLYPELAAALLYHL